MHPGAPYFSILHRLMPDDFTRQVESAATQWVNMGSFLRTFEDFELHPSQFSSQLVSLQVKRGGNRPPLLLLLFYLPKPYR
jgi:hypothetical protein